MLKPISLYAVLRKILSELNEQVVDHGDRVAYLYLKMREYRSTADADDMDAMMLSCYTHDIGAYKTEKFLDLLNFDVTHTSEHCIYGYLFMKYFSPLKDEAEVLLYHHTFYSERDKYKSPYLADGILIHFLDRVDIFNIKFESTDEVIAQMKSGAGKNFNPQDVEDFLSADAQYNILENLRDGSYRVDVVNFFNTPQREERWLQPIIDMLAYEVDFRSEQTVIHSVTTGEIAALLGKELGLTATEIQNLQYAARVHDLGKIKIPVEILEKPGKLTAEEYRIIQKHAIFTEMITGELFPPEIVTIAAHHHERLDGSGYPRGLTTADLSLSDRILQVADVTSALLQKRSYKQALEKATVIAILQEDAAAGKLDAVIVDRLVREYDIIIKKTMAAAEDVIERYESLQAEYRSYLQRYRNTEHDIEEEFPLFTKQTQNK